MEHERNVLASALEWIAIEVRAGTVDAVSLEYRDGAGRVTVSFQLDVRAKKAPDDPEE